jgi:hypothetical protein
MFDLINSTPFNVRTSLLFDLEGNNLAVAAVKGTFTLPMNGEQPSLAEEQLDVLARDDYDDPSKMSCIRYPADLVMGKNGTDIGLDGTAYSPFNKPVTSLKVSVQAGHLSKTVLVLGNRYWTKSLFRPGYAVTKPEPFERMPLTWERSYGGKSKSKKGETVLFAENPAGTGFVFPGNRVGGVRLPNVEDPKQRIRTWRKTYPPATFGFSLPCAAHRIRYSGTHDETWVKKRRPLPPGDLSLRFFNYAQPELVSDGFLTGGETVTLTHLTPDGQRSFQVPMVEIRTTFNIKGRKVSKKALVHTLMIEPDKNRFYVTWWAGETFGKSFHYVEWIKTEIVNG